MTLAEAIYRSSLNLPDSAAREALDFIEFLAQRYGVSENTSSTLTPEQQAALAGIAQTRIPFGGKPMVDREENPFRASI